MKNYILLIEIKEDEYLPYFHDGDLLKPWFSPVVEPKIYQIKKRYEVQFDRHLFLKAFGDLEPLSYDDINEIIKTKIITINVSQNEVKELMSKHINQMTLKQYVQYSEIIKYQSNKDYFIFIDKCFAENEKNYLSKSFKNCH